MSNFFCSNCKINLVTDDTMREHYKSEFHRYNIKRHLVSLPPITEDQFSKKKNEIIEARKTEKQSFFKCDTCGKNFSSKATYKQHMESKKHLDAENAAKKETTNILAEITTGSPTKDGVKRTQMTTVNNQAVCLFCNLESPDVDENLMHMRLAHSFFISELKYLKDLNGLLKYLGEKIHKGCLCIYCENHHCKDFKTGEAVQHHMTDKGHCFMRTEEFDEYHKYYDFSKSIQDMHNKMYLGDENEPLKDGEEYLEMEEGGDDDDENWEDDGDDEEDDEEEEEDGEGKKEKEGKEVKEGEEGKEVEEGKESKPKKVYRFKVRKIKVLDSGEIQLPNGKILGHRKYKTLYKQYIRESLRTSYFRNNFLGYSEERSLARLDQENRIMMMKKSLEEKKSFKQRFDKDKATKLYNRDHVRMGIKGNSLMPHYKNANPL